MSPGYPGINMPLNRWSLSLLGVKELHHYQCMINEEIHRRNTVARGEVFSAISDIGFKEKSKQDSNNTMWKDSIFKCISDLKNDHKGSVGEQALGYLCGACGIESTVNGKLTKERGGGCGDGYIGGRAVEVKSSTLGISNTFQHELGENPWSAELICLVDIAPSHIWLSLFPNWSEEHYKTLGRRATPYFTNGITRRKDGTPQAGSWKFDTNEKILNSSKVSLKILNDTSLDDIKCFIDTQIR